MVEIIKLEKEIKKHNKLYWNEHNPEISDQDYDNLVRKLEKLDPENSLLAEVHIPIVSNKKVKHTIPMLSLNKVYTTKELFKWCDKVARNQDEKFLIQVKFDGCSTDYENGILSTRGDGTVGENISDKISLINIPNKGDIRGEIVLTKSNFEKYKSVYKKRDGSEYSNSRNACAGILNRDDNSGIGQILKLIPFDYRTEIATLYQIKTKIDFEEMIQNAKNSDIPADGLVIKLADETYKKSLGFTSHHPKGEIALKFANEFAKSVLLDITWSCGKEVITPIGNIEPIELGGVTIKNVSLHNMKFILDEDIHIGDLLTVERAGDVIPHVIDVKRGDWTEDIKIPYCPECSSRTVYIEPNIKCTNRGCVGGAINKLYDSIVRLGIERIGKPTIKNMIQINSVLSLIDILNLTKEDLLKLPKFGEKKAQNTLNEIQKIKENGVYEWQILAAMNIPRIGRSLSKILSEKFGLNGLIDLCNEDNCINQLCEIEGIEEKRAIDIKTGVLENIEYIIDLFNLLPLKKYDAVENIVLPTVCFSGKFPEKKSHYYEKLEGKYVILNKVSKDLNILVVADPSKNSTKQQKAEKIGVKIMSIDEIMSDY